MIKSERDRIILSKLDQKEIVSVRELYAALADVSAVTVRRDVLRLAKQGKLERVRGGVMRKEARKVEAQPLDDDFASSIASDLDLQDDDDEHTIENIDAVILPPIEGQLARTIHRRARRTGVLCLDESRPDGDGVYLGVDNDAAGFNMGELAAADHREQARLQCLIVGHDGLTNTRQRQAGFLRGLRETFSGDVQSVFVDARGIYMEAFRQTRDALESIPDIDLIFAINDHSMLAAIDAARSLRRRNVAGYCVGGEGGLVFDELQKGDILRGFSAMLPPVVARSALNAITEFYAKPKTIQPIVTPHHVITSDNLTDYYECIDGEWQLLASVAEALAPMRQPLKEDSRDHSILFVQHYPTHHWYRSLSMELQRHCKKMGYEYHTASLKSQIVDEMRHTHREIAARAAQLVKPGDTVILNRGHTSRRLAVALHDIKPLTVITNSLSVLDALANSTETKVILTGGEFRKSQRDLVGPGMHATLQNVRADIAFYSVDGLSKPFGVSFDDEHDAQSVSVFMQFARRNVVLADHTVMEQDTSFRAAPFEQVDDIVTDFGVSPRQRIDYSATGMSLIVAGDPYQPIRIVPD